MNKLFFMIINLIILVSGCIAEKNSEESRLVNEPVAGSSDFDDRIFKIDGDRELELRIYYPEGYDPDRTEPYAAGVSFGGGGWVEGKIDWSYGGAEEMAANGMVGVAADYRRADFKKVSVLDAMKDANSSVRWLRIHAAELNVDPEKIMAFGISAGGHLAISTAMFPHFAEPSEDPAVSSVPNVVIGVCPAVAIANPGDPYFKKLLLRQEKAVNCSPLENVRPGIVPMYIMQGTDDEILPHHYTVEFVARMNEAGNKAVLYPFEGGRHDFYYKDPEGEKFWKKTFADIVLSLGWN